MKILVIGKPTYNVILPIDKFIVEGSKNQISDKLEMGGGTSFYTANLLGKWKVPVSYTGVVGSDIYGTKIKSDLESNGVNTKFLEINYEHPTNFNYLLINKTNGSSTEIIKINHEVNLTKYKYDFIPDILILDGTDIAGSLAALNNFPRATSILFANKVSEGLYDLSKRCTYVVANVDYAKALTKMELEIGKPKLLVNFMQRIKDLNKAQYIVMLREHGVLYTSNNQVKMIPAIKIEKKVDDTNSGKAFFAAVCYGIINNYEIDNTVKIANIAAGLSLTKMGSLNSIPELEEVLNLAGLKEVVTNNSSSNEVTEVLEEELSANQSPNE